MKQRPMLKTGNIVWVAMKDGKPIAVFESEDDANMSICAFGQDYNSICQVWDREEVLHFKRALATAFVNDGGKENANKPERESSKREE